MLRRSWGGIDWFGPVCLLLPKLHCGMCSIEYGNCRIFLYSGLHFTIHYADMSAKQLKWTYCICLKQMHPSRVRTIFQNLDICRLIWVLAGRICHFVGLLWLILQFTDRKHLYCVPLVPDFNEVIQVDHWNFYTHLMMVKKDNIVVVPWSVEFDHIGKFAFRYV